MIVVLIFVCFVIYSQYSSRGAEKFGGTAWFPRSYLQYITDTMENFVGSIGSIVGGDSSDRSQKEMTLETPNFGRFDIGNKFTSPNEVDGMYFNADDHDQEKTQTRNAKPLLFDQSGDQRDPSMIDEQKNANNDIQLITNEILYKRGGNASGTAYF